MKNSLAMVILAAGEGTRMKSKKPKVLHSISGKPLIKWVLSASYPLKPSKSVIVIGHGGDSVKDQLRGENALFVEQKKQLGSADALKQAKNKLSGFSGDIIVLCGDTPLIQPETLKALLKTHRLSNNAATVLTTNFSNPTGYGRILRSKEGNVLSIVEERDASQDQKKVKEINSGMYCFDSSLIWAAVSKIGNSNKKKEYYLTDVISILNSLGKTVGAYCVQNNEEILGINSRLDLACAEKIVQRNILVDLMHSGVTIIDPVNTYISADTKIGRDTVIYPGTIIEEKCSIGEGCIIGPNSFIKNSSIDSEVEIKSSYVVSSKVLKGAKIGPFSNLRPGSIIKPGAKVGNFSEIKNSTINEGAKVNHLSYIGDTYVGKKVNVGAGTITCNFDGVKKSKTFIGDGAFIGSNVNLIAPVKIGKNVILAAGSTITDTVPSDTLAIARNRQIHKKRKR
ncbi:bifunctional UDP-N-acetylglucosamine diphosphorylase/glucosamine-1-phosphate N-acetyltransferase GlmU [Elusimicrobiota bacterium]